MARASRTRTVQTKGEGQTHLEDLWDEPPREVRPVRSDLDLLQGAWASVSGRRPALLLVSGEHYAVRFADGIIYMGAYILGAEKRKKTMDARIAAGPAHHVGLVSLCLYELNGDTLHWCIGPPGRPDRPAAFAEQTPKELFLVLRREQANGKH